MCFYDLRNPATRICVRSHDFWSNDANNRIFTTHSQDAAKQTFDMIFPTQVAEMSAKPTRQAIFRPRMSFRLPRQCCVKNASDGLHSPTVTHFRTSNLKNCRFWIDFVTRIYRSLKDFYVFIEIRVLRRRQHIFSMTTTAMCEKNCYFDFMHVPKLTPERPPQAWVIRRCRQFWRLDQNFNVRTKKHVTKGFDNGRFAGFGMIFDTKWSKVIVFYSPSYNPKHELRRWIVNNGTWVSSERIVRKLPFAIITPIHQVQKK